MRQNLYVLYILGGALLGASFTREAVADTEISFDPGPSGGMGQSRNIIRHSNSSPNAPQGSSTAARPSSIPSESWLKLSTRYRRKSGLEEFRPGLLTNNSNLLTTPDAKPDFGIMAFSRTEFEVSASIFEDGASSARLDFMLPMNSVKSTSPFVPQGGEFGGVGVRLNGRYDESIFYRLSFDRRTSQKLKLYDTHHEFGAGGYLQVRDNFADTGLPMYFMAGPEIFAAVQPSRSLSSAKYGPQWGARAKMELETGAGTYANFVWTVDILMRRAMSYEVAGVNEGGAGLFTASPGLAYRLMDAIDVGLFMEWPIFRPKGREVVFGNIGLPGLFGPMMGLSLRAAAL